MKEERQSKRLYSNFDFALGFLIAIMAVLISVEVFGRTCFSYSTLIADEYSGYLLAIIAFLGLFTTMKAGSHIRVTFLLDRFGVRGRRYLQIFNYTFAIFYVGILFWALVKRLIYLYHTHTISTYFSKTPLYIPFLALPIGTCLLLITLILMAIRSLNKRNGG